MSSSPNPNPRPGGKALLNFPRDSHLRRRLFAPESFQHNAKANLFILQHLLSHYTRPGQTILDPMGGTGSLFVGGLGKRLVVCGEIENWLRPILAANRNRAAGWGQHGIGYQGDAAKLPLASGSVDAVITSPPYWDTFSDWHIASSNRLKDRHVGPYGSAYGDDRGQAKKRNLGNIHVYEDFLRAMRSVYEECYRVLRTGGILALIVKDRIHLGQRVPIVADFAGLLRVLGFEIVAVQSIATRLTQYRQIHKLKGQQVIEDEQIIVARKSPRPPRCTWAIVALPEYRSGPTAIVYQKALALSRASADLVWALAAPRGLLCPEKAPAASADKLAGRKARYRRDWAFGLCNDLAKKGLGTGDQIALHVPARYAAYLQERLTTFGCTVEIPTRGMNQGQKMAWLTKANSARRGGPNGFSSDVG